MPDNNKEDQFQLWLAEMDDALDRFLRRLPMGVAMRLDYTQASLLVLEKWLRLALSPSLLQHFEPK